MRVNLDWLREWVAIEDDAETVADTLTTAGLEVDGVSAAAPDSGGVVVARIEAVEPHPDADRLTVCTVDTGSATRRVVCGAPNVAPDLCVPYARPGVALPGGQVIAAAEIRGIPSEGMLCSAKELGLSDDASGLLVLDASASPGTPLEQHLKLDDRVLDVDLTPNRGDCFSVRGMAREIAAKRGIELSGPAMTDVAAQIEERFPVELEDPGSCPRFAGRVVRNLDLTLATPDWLCERLRRAGSRPIHPVVDVTNYVMLELGQPLHAYDLEKLSSKIIVRAARPGEPLTLLDGKQVVLRRNTLVIADDSVAIGMAGIMGGASTAVDTATHDVFLESAFFTPEAILGRARQYGLHTDASLRFERGVDPRGQERALERATELLLEIAGGTPGPVTVVEAADHLPTSAAIVLRRKRISGLLGTEIRDTDVETFLSRLEMHVERSGHDWQVVPPTFRFDIRIEEDLIEELGRMLGYDEVPITRGAGAASLGSATESRVEEEWIADALVARGYTEVITYGFTDAHHAEAVNPGAETAALINPISSDLAVLRRSLWPGLLSVAQQNLSRQQSRLRLFELGHQFDRKGQSIKEIKVLAGLGVGARWPEHWDLDNVDVDFYDVKADLEAVLTATGRFASLRFEAAEHPALCPGQTARVLLDDAAIGWLGSVHPKLQRVYDLKPVPILFAFDMSAAFVARVPSFQSVSKFPSVRRDLAVVVDEDVPVERLLDCVERSASGALQTVSVFDVYRGKGIESGRKSVALGLILQDASRTLTDRDADDTVQSVTQRLEHELGATIRT